MKRTELLLATTDVTSTLPHEMRIKNIQTLCTEIHRALIDNTLCVQNQKILLSVSIGASPLENPPEKSLCQAEILCKQARQQDQAFLLPTQKPDQHANRDL